MIDQKTKRQNIARQLIIAGTQYVDSQNKINQLKDEMSVVGNFEDTDFSMTTDMQHIDAYTVGVIRDFVIPSINANYADAANNGRNKELLLKLRK